MATLKNCGNCEHWDDDGDCQAPVVVPASVYSVDIDRNHEMQRTDGSDCPCFSEKKITPEEEETLHLQKQYMGSISACYDSHAAGLNFAKYDCYRAIFLEELERWLKGDDPFLFESLTDFAWKVQHDRISEGGTNCRCLNWSHRNQKAYLGDGYLEYLGILKDRVEGEANE